MAGAQGGGRHPRRRALLVIGLLVVAGVVVLATAGRPPARGGSPNAASSDPTDGASPLAVDDVLERAVANPDGSVTVTLDDDEAAGLVASALARAPNRPLGDVSVDLVAPEGDADGRMIVAGRLDEPSLPVEAVVDLRVVDDAVRPTVTDVRVGPVPLPAGVRRELDRQVARLALVAEDRLTIRELSTADDALVLTGRPR